MEKNIEKEQCREQYIGRKVIEHQDINRLEAMEKHDEWLLEGQKYQDIRIKIGISVKRLSRKVGVSPGVIHRFERGMCIKRRKLVVASLQNALKYLALEHAFAVQDIPLE